MGFEKKPTRKKTGTKSSRSSSQKRKRIDPENVPQTTTRLNKYIAQSGVCSRREADKLIEAGKIKGGKNNP